MSNLAGRVLGNPGGTGITYLGFNLELRARVAIKEYLPRDLALRAPRDLLVRPHSTEDAARAFQHGLDAFLREARTLARFDHPNIVRVRSFFRGNGTAYLVMDYYEGVSLQEYVRRHGGVLDPRLAVNIMVPVLDGLAEAHAHGIMHCDIKPANIYLTTSGRAILLDFGAAKQMTMERTGTLNYLTPGYAPLELYQQGGWRGPAVDIYSCGATLCFLLTGRLPPDAVARATGTPLPPLGRGVSPQLHDVVVRAMQMTPTDRVSDARTLQSALLSAR